MVIAIDGLSTNGKTTLAKRIARDLNFQYFNTGAIYRCFALEIINKNLDIVNLNKTIMELKKLQIQFLDDCILLNGVDVTNCIQSDLISLKSTEWASIPQIKEVVFDIQRKFLKEHDTVMEGRDICTRIAPDAEMKFYLYSDFEIRVQRLWKKNGNVDIDCVRRNLKKVDEMDIYDGIFVKPIDAIEIDTTLLSLEQVYENMMDKIHQFFQSNKKIKLRK